MNTASQQWNVMLRAVNYNGGDYGNGDNAGDDTEDRSGRGQATVN